MLKSLLFAAALLAGTVAQAANPTVELRTSMGSMVIELYPDKAPETVRNFLDYVKSGFYNGTVFHRVIDGFMIQGGGYDADYHQKATRAPIRNEADNGLRNEAYSVAMARTGDPHSATSQFFINVADNAFLNYRSPDIVGYGYCVFGKVIRGQEVARKISRVETGVAAPIGADVPLKTVVIEKVVLLNK